jgi:hypothetical protein
VKNTVTAPGGVPVDDSEGSCPSYNVGIAATLAASARINDTLYMMAILKFSCIFFEEFKRMLLQKVGSQQTL